MRQGLNFNHLESFLKVAEYLSFSKASQDLNIAQPAISKQIKNLEEFFDEQLFIRNKQRVNLTPFGQKIVDELGGLHSELGQRVFEIQDRRAQLSGPINIGCLAEVGEKVFVKALSNFKKNYPDILINIKLLKGHQIIEGIKAGRLQIGIVAEEILLENIRCYKVLDEEIILVANNQTNIPEKTKLNNLPFVSYSNNDPLLLSYLQKFTPRFQSQRLNLEFQVNSHKAMIELIKIHPYFCVLPKLSAQEELKKKTIKQVSEKCLKSSLYLVQQDQEYPDRKVAVLSAFLRKLKY